MNANSLPSLRPTDAVHRASDVASTLPPPKSPHAVADYTYKPQLRDYTQTKHISTFPGAPVPPVLAPAAPRAAQAGPSTAKEVVGSTAATTPHHTAAVFQAKLQRALWLDQLTSCAHAESTARAGLRCSEAESREALWWSHQQETARLLLDEAYTYQTLALADAQARQQQLARCAPLYYLIEQAEPAARRAIECDVAEAFQLLCVAESTSQLRLSARKAAAEHQAAETLGQTAAAVRALELDMATRSYRPIPVFDPFVEDLERIADGLSPMRGGRKATLAEQWQRKVSQGKGASAAATAAAAALAKLHRSAEDQGTLKITELYARRYLRYDEEKERLLLEWWQGVGEVAHVQEAHARQQLWDLYAFVTSPARMTAVVALQRWWRVLRGATWTQHRRHHLAASLAALPHRLSSSRYKRQLRTLEHALAQSGSCHGDGSISGGSSSGSCNAAESDNNNSEAGAATQRLATLVAAATHPRRYAMQEEMYAYTVAQKTRAFCAGLGISPALFLRELHVEEKTRRSSTESGEKSCNTWPLFKMPFDAWRQHRWPSHASQQRQTTESAVKEEMENRGVVTMMEKHARVHLNNFACVLRSGPAALRQLLAAQQALTKAATKAYQRTAQQEEHERRVCVALCHNVDLNSPLLSLSLSAQSASSAQVPRVPAMVTLPPSAQATKHSRIPTHRKLSESQTRTPHAVRHRNDAATGSPLSLRKAQQCVQRAAEELAVLHQGRRNRAQRAEEAAGKVAAAGASEMPESEDAAVRLYSNAFDRAAAQVYTEQYVDVHARFAAANGDLLRAIQEIIQEVLSDKSAIATEEDLAWEELTYHAPSSHSIQQFQCTVAEERERALLISAQLREVTLAQECFRDRVALLL